MNWDSIILSFIVSFFGSLPATIAALAAFWKSHRTEHAVNGKMGELVALTRKEAAAQATLNEKERQTVRAADVAMRREQRDETTHK